MMIISARSLSLILLWLALLAALAAPRAFACPDLAAAAPISRAVPADGGYLVVRAGGLGGVPAQDCVRDETALASLDGDIGGNLPVTPTAAFTVAEVGEGAADLIFSTAMINPETMPEDGILLRCDTVMLIQSPDGQVHFSDDGGSANLSLLRLPRQVGTYQVWVGPYSDGVECAGQIRVRSADLPCPGPDFPAQLTATALGESWSVAAGGPRDIRGCQGLADLFEGGDALGFISFAPTLDIPADMDITQDRLIIDGVAVCDTVLLALDGAGNWYFSDDSGDDLNPQIALPTADFAGAKVWFGAYDIGNCSGSLRLSQQSSLLCPDPDLPPSNAAILGGQTQIATDGIADLAICGESLVGLMGGDDGGDVGGFTSLAPDAALDVASVIETTSITANLASSCAGEILVHMRDEQGGSRWQMLAEIPFGPDTVQVTGPGTYSFWLVNADQAGCAGTLSLGSEPLSCPRLDLPGKQAERFDLEDLIEGQRLPVVAGGKTNLQDCPAIDGLAASGTYIDRPDFEITMKDASALIFESEGQGQCDTTLIIADGNGSWYFSDDDASDSNGGLITLPQDVPGPFKVWVGTFGPDLCEGALLVRRGLFKE